MIEWITASTFGHGPKAQTQEASELSIGVDGPGRFTSSRIAAATQLKTTTALAEQASWA